MTGANEYAPLFRTGQYGRLYIVSGAHARGATFHIFVLPDGETGIDNGPNNAPQNADAVEVYGITGGNPGWTETYGWLHRGPWEADFAELVTAAIGEQTRHAVARQKAEQAKARHKIEREGALLATYSAQRKDAP